ncbi:MAG TPA: DsrE family protein [Actinomycetota bacterium]
MTIVIHASHGAEDPERATLPFVLGNNAAVAGQDPVILLIVEAVHLATEGGADGVQKQGLPPLPEIMAEYVSNGGAIWACRSCTKPRGIEEGDLSREPGSRRRWRSWSSSREARPASPSDLRRPPAMLGPWPW